MHGVAGKGIYGRALVRDGQALGNLVAAEAGESRLVVGIEAGVITAAASTATGKVTATVATTATTLATATATTGTIATSTIATATAAVTASAAAATTGSTSRRALGLNPGLVNIQDVLSLALTLALGLATGSSNEVLAIVLVESLGIGPLLVGLAALIGLADLEATKTELLLGLLGKVLLVRNALGLRLGRSLGALSILSGSLLELPLRDLLAGLLILLLSIAFVGAPRLSSLLVGTAGRLALRVPVVTVTRATAPRTTTVASTTAATGTTAGSLVDRAALIGTGAGVTVTESSLVAARATASTTGITSVGGFGRGLGLDTALGGAHGGLVDSLHGSRRRLLLVIAEEGEKVL